MSVAQGEIKKKTKKKSVLRQPGIEPGSVAWKATMIAITPLARVMGDFCSDKEYLWEFGIL
jgi:hypothetical protein